jgi:hypothetical protein
MRKHNHFLGGSPKMKGRVGEIAGAWLQASQADLMQRKARPSTFQHVKRLPLIPALTFSCAATLEHVSSTYRTNHPNRHKADAKGDHVDRD